jgi:hypothetical protein
MDISEFIKYDDWFGNMCFICIIPVDQDSDVFRHIFATATNKGGRTDPVPPDGNGSYTGVVTCLVVRRAKYEIRRGFKL